MGFMVDKALGQDFSEFSGFSLSITPPACSTLIIIPQPGLVQQAN
jgi:hypothetical protein